MVICDPLGWPKQFRIKGSKTRIPIRGEPVQGFVSAVDKGGTIAVIFFRHIDGPHSLELYRCFWSPLRLGSRNDGMTQLADTPHAKVLAEVLKPALPRAVTPLAVIKASQFSALEPYSPNECQPVLVNPVGGMHAFWCRLGKGGVLFLPAFKDNFSVIKALLQLPLNRLTEIPPEEPIAESDDGAAASSPMPMTDVSDACIAGTSCNAQDCPEVNSAPMPQQITVSVNWPKPSGMTTEQKVPETPSPANSAGKTADAKEKNRPTAAEMANRERVVAATAVKLRAEYDRLPTVDEIAQKTKYTRQQIYATSTYKEGNIAKSSAKATTETFGGCVAESEYIAKNSVQHSRADRRSKAKQAELDALIDEQEKDKKSRRA